MVFLLEWLTFYIAIIFAMCVDNIFWVHTSPEWSSIKKQGFIEVSRYILRNRVWAVIKHPLDIIPAVITSFILAVIL